MRKGTYVLFLRFSSPVSAEIGALGTVSLEAGDYCYVGSAMGGLDQRVNRHLRHQKTVRWHIDYLTVLCSDMKAYEHEGTDISECRLGEILEESGAVPAAKGFGCSDCRCFAHLFRIDRETAENAVIGAGLAVFRASE